MVLHELTRKIKSWKSFLKDTAVFHWHIFEGYGLRSVPAWLWDCEYQQVGPEEKIETG